MKPQGKVTIFMVVMIVMLSVYYFAISRGDNKEKNTNPDTQDVVKCEQFETLRTQVDTARDEMIATFNGILSSSTVTVAEKDAALDKISELQNLALDEDTLETEVMGLGFNDAFVKAGENDVQVSVFVDSMTMEQINQIIVLSKTRFGQEKQIVVDNIPINGEDTLN